MSITKPTEPERRAVVILRHGETDFKASGVYQGASDAPALTELGRLQSESLSAYVANMHVRRVFCSPLGRARETLSILGPALPGSPACEVREELTEVDHPQWRDRKKSEILERDGASLHLWRTQPEVFTDTDGRSILASLYARARSLAKELVVSPGVSLVVGHDHINRALMSILLNWPLGTHKSLPQSLSGLSLLNATPADDGFELRASNLHSREFGSSDSDSGIVARLILVRHGVTAANRARVYQGPVWDPPLEAEGVDQMHRLAGMLDSIAPRAVISSRLRRAVQSAQLVPGIDSMPRIVDDRLQEFHYGRWSGLTPVEVGERFPDEVTALYREVAENPIVGGEPLTYLFARVQSFLSDAWPLANGGTVVVVAHDVVIRALITLSMRLPRRCFWQVPIENGAMTELALTRSNFVQLRRHNVLPGRLEERHDEQFL